MKNKRHLYYWGIIYILLIASCQIDKTSPPTSDSASQIFTLEKDQPYYQLQSYIQILEDATSKHSIEDILQSDLQDKFQAYPNHTLNLQNHKYYWGKIQLENHLPDAAEHLEWVLSFSTSWTEMDIYTQDRNGKWRQERNGIFTPERTKKFVPTTKGNLMKIALLPEEVVTIYFRGISERASINPSFYVYLENLESYYNDLLKTKTNEAIYLGFLLMMFLYNLIVYFFGRDRSFIFYSGYLIMMVIYSGYTSGDLTNWLGIDLFPNHPQYWIFMKLSIYLGLMCYLAFIRSFLDLKELLPKWGLFYKIVIYLGFPLVLLDVFILYLSNFSNVIEDTVSIFYIIFVMVTCCSLIYPLFKTKDKKGYFIIAGIAAISIGSILTIFSRVSVTNFSIFYLQGGTIIEVIIFSLGLAYRQRKQEQAKQQADFKLKESQLIQEKKQIEANRLKELNGFKARFYTNITHEFRTPLTVIMGMSDNLKNHSQEKKLIQRNSKNLLRLINQLLDLSKLESGTLQLNNIHQDIIAYLQYLTESFYSAATQKNIRLLFYSEEKVIMMDFDEEKIQQIVYNLLSNALKFTPRDGKIIFHANQTEQDGQPFLKLKIKDTGIGISPKNISHIFDRFYQVNHSGHYKEEGTGIGLALTKELVELMDGQIEVESQPKEGTEFTLNLPVKAQMKATVLDKKKEVQKVELYEQQPIHFIDENKKENKTPEETQPILISSFPELLIIEDNSDIITYIKTILNNDYNIHTAKNGLLGIEKAVEIIPDIIISDVMMPEKNGYEVCETLKQDERTSHIPIILLTARATQTDKVDGLKYGADAYLTKPFDKEELLIQLKNLVDIRQQLQLRYTNSTILNEKPAELSVEDIFLQKLHEHIQEHLSDAEFGVTQLALAIPISQMQLYRKLKALTNKTPSQFIRSYRLQKALELLKTGQFNVSEIAYDVGFTDPSYFSRVFQKEFGRNPSQFITN